MYAEVLVGSELFDWVKYLSQGISIAILTFGVLLLVDGIYNHEYHKRYGYLFNNTYKCDPEQAVRNIRQGLGVVLFGVLGLYSWGVVTIVLLVLSVKYLGLAALIAVRGH